MTGHTLRGVTAGSFKPTHAGAIYPPMRLVVRAVPLDVDGKTTHAYHMLECGHNVTKKVLVRPMNRCPCMACALERK